MSFTVFVLTGGDPVPTSLKQRLPRADLVIAADSGYHLAPLLGLDVDLVIGDFDSIDPGADLSGSEVIRHPTDKDHSDLELAFAAATARNATDVVVVGGGGGRLDHLLANAAVIAGHNQGTVTWLTGSENVHVITSSRTIAGSAGDTVTLLALGGDVRGVTTDGLRYPLDRETLPFGSARGLSNVMLTSETTVSIDSGVLIAVHIPSSDDVL
ncbi:MAG TPA: thiamine diphosphokinase [Acidimicrobiia bacterium]|nr:thiamine diphosphokinase [Acidimicrobiia bacterium]